MWNYISANQATVSVASSTEGINKVLAGNYAFLMEYVFLIRDLIIDDLNA
jgi:hypothetical protein